MLDGHELVVIVENEWLLDMTEYKLYKIDKGINTRHCVTSCACRWDTEEGRIKAHIINDVPYGIVRVATEAIEDYERRRGSTVNGIQRTIRGKELLHPTLQ